MSVEGNKKPMFDFFNNQSNAAANRKRAVAKFICNNEIVKITENLGMRSDQVKSLVENTRTQKTNYTMEQMLKITTPMPHDYVVEGVLNQ